MNHLAHVYLSFDDPAIMAGNLFADYLSGNKVIKTMPEGVRKGIYLHRKIDQYTDTHRTVKRSKKRLYKRFGKYTPVAVDIYYDYCLSALWSNYCSLSLQEFANDAYQKLISYQNLMPGQLGVFFPEMLARNWLVSYGTLAGIQFTFDRLSKRALYAFNFDKAAIILSEHEGHLKEEFAEFFPDLIGFVKEQSLLL